MANKKKGVQFVLLVEDKAFSRLITRTLIALGFNRNKLRIITYPVGEGSNEQWVREKYPDEVKAHRSRKHQKNLILIVGTDADKLTVKKRKQKLSNQLIKANLPARSTDEQIVIWIPKRTIETLVLYLAGEDVSEEDDRKVNKNRVKKLKPKYKLIGEEFVTRYRNFKNEKISDSLPSLQSAFDETKQRMP